MSDVVGTGTVELYRGQHQSGGVPVAVGGVAALRAPEDSFGEPEALLGYREALRARHGGVGRRNQHHLPARPHTLFDQLPLGRADRGLLVALRRGVPAGPLAAGHPPLRSRQLGRRALAVPAVGQVERRIGGCRGGGHAPVDADTAGRSWGGGNIAAHDERGVPVPQAVLVDAHSHRQRCHSSRSALSAATPGRRRYE